MPTPPVTLNHALARGASMMDMIEAVWAWPRDLVSDGYDRALAALASQIDMSVHEYPTGTPCWTWIVPEKWTCREGYVETMQGTRLFSYADNPLHVASYSRPIDREVSRAELLDHLSVHPLNPDAVAYDYCFFRDTWRLCCSARQRDALTDERYRVRIDAEFSPGSLKVGEVHLPGRRPECVVLCAHLDHPMQVNDGLSGVVVGIDVMRRLAAREDREYSYRLIIVSETIGSIAYLSHHEHLVPSMAGGLFLEMLGLDNPHSLQLSHARETAFDRCCRTVVRDHDPAARLGSFLEVVTNDERQFNAPGVRVPMLSLSRVTDHCSNANRPPFPEYHSDFDSPALTRPERLAASRDLVLSILDGFEADRVPMNRYKGEVFLSRFGIHYDYTVDPDYGQALFKVMHAIDGTRSLVDIAFESGIALATVRHIVDRFAEHGLVAFRTTG